jgi:putative ABC transport system permease protein
VIVKLVFESLRHRPVRTLLSALLIGVPVTLILTLVGLSRGMLEDSARRAKGVGADIVIRPPGTSLLTLSSAPMSEKLVDVLRQEPHVEIATGTMIHPVSGVTTVTGVDLEQFTRMSGGFRYLEGGPFETPDDILLGEYWARQENVHAGGKITLLNREWRVAGVVEEGKLARIILPIGVLQDLTANTGKISQIYLKLDDERNIPQVIPALKEKLPNYPIYSMEELTSLISVNNVPALRSFINVMIVIAMVIGFAVVCLSMYMAVLQRTREIGILKSMGASKGYILQIVMAEAAFLGLTGTAIGIVLSFGAQYLINNLVPAALQQATVPDWWPIALMIALIAALAGALYPGYLAARQDPIEALAYE